MSTTSPVLTTPRHAALHVIQNEHQALSAMLRSMQLLVGQAARAGTVPDFALLRAMLFYVDEFPERLHHPKESSLLFPRLRARCPGLAATIDELDQDHAHGGQALRALAHALLAWEVLGASRQEAFEQALNRYVSAYLRHMALEESELLPAAREHLSQADWAELDAAFTANRDPLTGHAPATEFEPLFQRILNQAPAPIGLG